MGICVGMRIEHWVFFFFCLAGVWVKEEFGCLKVMLLAYLHDGLACNWEFLEDGNEVSLMLWKEKGI
jgi:hypothetical protein